MIIGLLVFAGIIGFITFKSEILRSPGVIIYVDDDYPFEDPWHKQTIQVAIDAAFYGDTVYVYSGNYTENVVVYKEITLTGEDRETTIIDGNGNGDTVHISSNRVTMSGFTVKNCGGIWPEEDAGIELDNVQNCTLFNNNVSDNGAHGIFLYYSSWNDITDNAVSWNHVEGIYLRDSPYNHITGNDVWANAFGIHLESSPNNVLANNDISSNGGTGIWLTGSSGNFVTDNDVSNNDIISLRMSWHNIIKSNNISGAASLPYGISLWFSNWNDIVDNNLSASDNGIYLYHTSNNNSITGNHITSTDYSCIHIHNSSFNTIMGNYVFSLNHDGILLEAVSHTNIKNNTVSWNGRYGISLWWSSSGNTIENNSVSNSGASGIYLHMSSNTHITSNKVFNNFDCGIHILESSLNNVISNNEVYVNLIGCGIYVDGSTNSTMIGNDVYLNPQGIKVHASNDNKFTANDVSFNAVDGIYLEMSSNNAVTNNNISKNSNGIYLSSASECNITDNVVLSNNNFGIYLSSSGNNRIYHNDIIDNKVQAFDDLNGSFWNDTYPSGGNYWSDYDGIDIFKGPYQNISGNDGIGDTPYSSITGGSGALDYYPLMNGTGNYLFLSEGWNLISLPLIQSDTRLSSVLSSIDGSYDAVRWYNATDTTDPWKHNHTAKLQSLNDLHTLDHKMGFWIHVTEPGGVLFEYFGSLPTTSQGIQLHPGWNIVGYPSLTSYNRTDGLNNTEFGTHINVIYWYDASTRTWNNMQKSDYFERGRGYWVHAREEIVWDVPL